MSELDTSLFRIDLPESLAKTLNLHDIHSANRLLMMKKERLLKIKGIGRKKLAIIEDAKNKWLEYKRVYEKLVHTI